MKLDSFAFNACRGIEFLAACRLALCLRKSTYRYLHLEVVVDTSLRHFHLINIRVCRCHITTVLGEDIVTVVGD